ncbi:MAG: DUF4234 domain-containing protein [Solirubrobacterales bacterium]
MAVAALSFVTLGIYFLYWWYQVNREMVDLGRARNAEGLGDNPTLSLLAMFPGGLVLIPPIFSMYNGVQRMKRAQEIAVGNVTMNGWIVFALYAGSFIVGVAGLIVPGYIQDELNKVWKAGSALERGGAQTQTSAASIEGGSTQLPT